MCVCIVNQMDFWCVLLDVIHLLHQEQFYWYIQTVWHYLYIFVWKWRSKTVQQTSMFPQSLRNVKKFQQFWICIWTILQTSCWPNYKARKLFICRNCQLDDEQIELNIFFSILNFIPNNRKTNTTKFWIWQIDLWFYSGTILAKWLESTHKRIFNLFFILVDIKVHFV